MSGHSFQFKQFKVNQQGAAMKVGTDGVLLGAWFDGSNCNSILDVGTGTGLLALMAAQRFENATIHAIDIDENAENQAKENFEASPWRNRLSSEYVDFKQYTNQLFDLIICNPPYFVQSLKAPDKARTQARHDDELPLSDLANGIAKALNSNGKASIILPPKEMAALTQLMAERSLYVSRQLLIYPTPDKPIKRIITEFSRLQVQIQTDELIIETNGRHGYSPEYKQLTQDFYLAF